MSATAHHRPKLLGAVRDCPEYGWALGALPTLAWACLHDGRGSGGSDARSIGNRPLLIPRDSRGVRIAMKPEHPESQRRCSRCDTAMECGHAVAHSSWFNSPLVFVVEGEPTSRNPVEAFRQGVEGLQEDKAYVLRGYRCPECGSVELTAHDQTTLRALTQR